MSRLLSRRLVAFGAVSAMAVAAFVVASPAGAVSYQGELLAKDGSYFVQDGIVSASVAAGGTATYTVEVKNTGSVASQYLLGGYFYTDGTMQVLDGSLDVTQSAIPEGYYTPLIKAGAVHVFTVKIKLFSTATIDTTERAGVTLYSTDEQVILGSVSLYTNRASGTTKGSGGADLYVSTTGQNAVESQPDAFHFQAGQAMKPKGTTKFTVKVQNDTTSTSHPSLALVPFFRCGTPLPLKVTVSNGGDVTSALENQSFIFELAPTKSLTVTLTITYPAAQPGCGGESYFVTSQNVDNGSEIGGEVNLAAEIAS